MTTFKVGDRVLRTEAVALHREGIKQGGEYTVAAIGKDGHELKVEGSNYWFVSKYFDLIPSDEVKTGDRVRVTYEGTVTGKSITRGTGLYVKTDKGQDILAYFGHIEKITPKLPTTTGSVIKVTKWNNSKGKHILVLSARGEWMHTAGFNYTSSEVEKWATEWEVVYDPE